MVELESGSVESEFVVGGVFVCSGEAEIIFTGGRRTTKKRCQGQTLPRDRSRDFGMPSCPNQRVGARELHGVMSKQKWVRGHEGDTQVKKTWGLIDRDKYCT